MMTLWSIFRSPLMMGGDLPHNDAPTTALLTNDEVLAVDQHSSGGHAVLQSTGASVWTAKAVDGKSRYVAIFNTSNQPQELNYTWKQLEWPAGGYVLRDLWEHSESRAGGGIKVHLAPHASVLYRASSARD
jgi:hypothetical protein